MSVQEPLKVATPHGENVLSPGPRHEISLSGKNAALDAVEDVLFGSIAGITGKFIEYPFDTVKVRLQSQPDHLPLRYTGPLDCFKQSFRAEGIAGLYRGISAPLVGAALENSSLFVSEQLAQKMVYASGIYSKTEALPLPALFFTGAAAGAVTSLVLTPVELIKCKMQVPVYTADAGSAPRKPTISATIKSVFRHQGITGFWHGQFATFLRETGGGAAWFGSKEAVSALFRKHNIQKDTMSAETEGADKQPLPLWQQAVAGAAAGMSYNFLFFPADTVKSRMQTAAHDGGVMQTSFWVECTALWKQAGLRGMYRGCGITVFRSAPSSAFIFIIYDGLKSKFSFS